MIGVGNLEVIHTGTLILYDWDILGSSIYIVDILRIDDLRIDDQSSILRSSIYRVFNFLVCLDGDGEGASARQNLIQNQIITCLEGQPHQP